MICCSVSIIFYRLFIHLILTIRESFLRPFIAEPMFNNFKSEYKKALPFISYFIYYCKNSSENMPKIKKVKMIKISILKRVKIIILVI